MRDRFHSEARLEFRESIAYYHRNASPRIAKDFVETVEAAIDDFVTRPGRWRVVAEPGLRRCLLKRFPFAIYFRVETEEVVIYAVMHNSREPNYWIHRVDDPEP